MKTKQICFFNCTKAWGGGEKWHFTMASALHRDGYKILVIAHPDGLLAEKCRHIGIPLKAFSVSNLSFLNPISIFSLYSLFKSQKTDSLIINSSPDLKLAGYAGHKAGVRNIIYRRGLAAPVKNSVLNRYIFQKIITRVITNSEATKRKLLDYNPDLIPSKKITILHNALDISEFDELNHDFEVERAKGEIILGSMGRLVHQKNQKVLIQLAEVLKGKGIDFKIYIAGSGPLYHDLRQSAKKKGVENDLVFCGFVNDTKGFMNALDVFILPSLWEGFGFVLVEAMAATKPVVAFNLSSNPEVVKDGKTGFLADPSDNESLINLTLQLIEDKELRMAFGKAGRKRVEDLFSFEKGKEAFIRFLNLNRN